MSGAGPAGALPAIGRYSWWMFVLARLSLVQPRKCSGVFAMGKHQTARCGNQFSLFRCLGMMLRSTYLPSWLQWLSLLLLEGGLCRLPRANQWSSNAFQTWASWKHGAALLPTLQRSTCCALAVCLWVLRDKPNQRGANPDSRSCGLRSSAEAHLCFSRSASWARPAQERGVLA